LYPDSLKYRKTVFAQRFFIFGYFFFFILCRAVD